MYARLALSISVMTLATVLVVPAAFAAASSVPIPLAPGEKLISHTSASHKDSQYVIDLLSSIKGIRIGADKTTVLIDNGGTAHPIDIEYGSALSASAKGAGDSGTAGATGSSGAGGVSGSRDAAGSHGAAGSSAGGGLGLGQIAGILLGLTVISRVIGIVRQLGGARR